MLIPLAIAATAFTGVVWVCLLAWITYRWCKFCRDFNRAASVPPELRNYD
ncbi:TPA: hypothetical protein LLS51_004436 [Serratia marcescens]|nr:hypothetical protein [Serratia marcescens]HBK4675008.1 hypothetical protein [Serratia marcescens]